MIAVDTNILVYSHRAEFPQHSVALAVMTELVEGDNPWVLFTQVLVEFYGQVTNGRRLHEPSSPDIAMAAIDSWLASPMVEVLCESSGFLTVLRKALVESNTIGPSVHDARIAALCRYHGVDELITADRDFNRFKGFRVRNPFE